MTAPYAAGPTRVKPRPASGVRIQFLHRLGERRHHLEGVPDQTEIGLYLLKEKPPLRYESVPVVNATFEIPPGEADAPGSKIRRMTIAPLIAEAIKRIADESSVSSLFD